MNESPKGEYRKIMKYYFAYGSNMDKDDLDKWRRDRGYPIIQFISELPAKLDGYKLAFNYYSSSRKGGAANIMENKDGCVFGVLLEMDEDNLNIIRKKEGYPDYYDEINVDIEKFDGTLVKDVKTYKVVKNREKTCHQPPTKYYLQLITCNAEKYGFPVNYITYIKSIETKD